MDRYKAYVEKVIDGDTLELLIDCPLDTHRRTVRLKEIDTPESRTSNKLEDQAGELVKQYINKLLLNKTVYVLLEPEKEHEKYGRNLCTIFFNESDTVSINTNLINLKFARTYDGGKKPEWAVSELEYIINSLK